MWPVRTCFNWYVITWSGKAGLKQLKLKWTVGCFVMVSLCIFPEENMINPSCSTSAKISKHALVVFLPILQYNPYEKQFVIVHQWTGWTNKNQFDHAIWLSFHVDMYCLFLLMNCFIKAAFSWSSPTNNDHIMLTFHIKIFLIFRLQTGVPMLNGKVI